MLRARSIFLTLALLLAQAHASVLDEMYNYWLAGDFKALVKTAFAPKAVYYHTDFPSAQGSSEIKRLLKKIGPLASADFKVIDVQQAGRSKVAIVLRAGYRDMIVLHNNRVKMMMSTRASPDDKELPEMSEPTDWASPSNSMPGSTEEREMVRAAVNSYFEGFQTLNGAQMADAFVQDSPYMMFDFNSERQVPFACAMSADCGTAPLMTSQAELQPAMDGFTNGFITLNHVYTKVKLLGSELAYATTVTLGCEGDFVTPPGTGPMPNRELFVLVKTSEAGWKIKNYMFTYDPASFLTPPVKECTEPATVTTERVIAKFLANTGNADVLREIVSPTLTYVSLNFRNDNLTRIMPWAGSHPNDGEALIETFARVSKFWQIDEFNAVDIIAQDERVAVFGDFTYTSTVLQKTVKSPFAINAKVHDGLLTYMMFMEDTLITSQSFWKSGQRTYVSDPDTLEEVTF